MSSSRRRLMGMMLTWPAVSLPIAGLSSWFLDSVGIVVMWVAVTAMVMGGLLAAWIAAPATDDVPRA